MREGVGAGSKIQARCREQRFGVGRTGQFDEAVDWLEEAVEANPGSVALRNALAATLRGLGAPEHAVEQYRGPLGRSKNSFTAVRLGQVSATTATGGRVELSLYEAIALSETGRADLAEERLANSNPVWVRRQPISPLARAAPASEPSQAERLASPARASSNGSMRSLRFILKLPGACRTTRAVIGVSPPRAGAQGADRRYSGRPGAESPEGPQDRVRPDRAGALPAGTSRPV